MTGTHLKLLATIACLSTTHLLIGPATVAAQGPQDHLLYSQPHGSSELVQYRFSDDTLESIGSVQLGSGTEVTRIDALAHVPHHTNLFAFWLDPSDRLTKLVYVNSLNAEATIVGHDMGPGRITGAVAAKLQHGVDLTGDQPTPLSEARQHELYGVQENVDVQFEIDHRQVVPSESFAAKVTVLGAAISYSGHYDMPVTARFQIAGTVAQPFGELTSAIDGNINDHRKPRSYIFPQLHAAATPISIVARSWKKKNLSYSGDNNRHWQPMINVNSNQNAGNVITLRNGDNVPNITPFLNQVSIVDFIREYIDPETNTVTLKKNQAIYLFELGTTDLSSSAADFQDLVVLVTLAKHPDDLANPQSSAPARLIKIDPKTGATEPIMPLDRQYESLAASAADTFYGTFEGRLYRIDPASETETLIEASTSVLIGKVAFASPTLFGLGQMDGDPALLNLTQGQATDMPNGLAHQDLGPIVFVRAADIATPLHGFD